MESKYDFKKILKIIGLVVLILICLALVAYLIFAVWFMSAIGASSSEVYLEVPMTITILGSDIEVTPLNYIPEDADIYVFTKEKASIIPENCSVDAFQFALTGPEVIYPEVESKTRGHYQEINFSTDRWFVKYGSPQINDYNIFLKESNNNYGVSKSKLSSNKDNLQFKYLFFPFTHSDPYASAFTYPPVIDTLGCRVYVMDSGIAEEEMLQITGTEAVKSWANSQIICLRLDNVPPKTSAFSTQECTFFKAESKTSIKLNIDLNKGQKKVYTHPVL